MIKFTSRVLLVVISLVISPVGADDSCSELLNFDRTTLTGNKQLNLCEAYQGKVVLIVNVASECGFTYQYEGLETLYQRYKERGLVVLGFPSNDFANQEPGSADEIAGFCQRTFDVNFPMFKKSHVAYGTNDPLFRALARVSGEYPTWNFHKYLIDRNGNLAGSFGSRTEPLGSEIINAVENVL